MLCTDVTPQIVDEAIREGCQCILTHHPLLFHPLRHIEAGASPIEEVVIKAIRAGISIYSSHTPMDQWIHGISGQMAKRLGLHNVQILHQEGDDHGYGAIGTLSQPLPFTDVLHLVKEAFGVGALRYTEPAQDKVQTIAMCGGAGSEFVEDAMRAGADVYISGDWKHHELLAAQGQIALIDTGHWESEQYIKDIYRSLLQDTGLRILNATADISPVKAY